MISYKNRRFKGVIIITIISIVLIVILAEYRRTRAFVADDIPQITFSRESGFYNDDFDLSIYTSKGDIYYTLDGTTPTCESIKYEGPIHLSDASQNENVYSMREDVSTGFYENLIEEYAVYEAPGYKAPDFKIDKCNVVRAVVYYGNGKYSEVKTGSFFVGFDNKDGYKDMNYISIVTDPDNLFDYNDGIYVTGAAFDDYLANVLPLREDWNYGAWYYWRGNYTKGYAFEKEASCQFFDSEGNLLLSQRCGINIHGDGSRGFNPRSLNLKARDSYYGHYDHFMYNFFGGSYYPRSVMLTQGGDDYETKFRDSFMSQMTENLNVATMDMVPYVLFLDGEYWGVYWLSERYDEQYLQYHFSVQPNNILMMKNYVLEIGEETDEQLFWDMFDFVTNSDLNDPVNYERLEKTIDIDSFVDYFASFICTGRNGDWPIKNVALWRTKNPGSGKYDDCRWRWMIFDANSLGMTDNMALTDSIGNALHEPIFNGIMTCDKVREKLLDRITELYYDRFTMDHVEGKFTEFRELMDEPMRKNNERFFGADSYDRYVEHLDSIHKFFERRGEYIDEMVKEYRGKRIEFNSDNLINAQLQ